MEIESDKIEETYDYKIALQFAPFIDPKCKEHLEIIKDFAKSINIGYKSIYGGKESLLKTRVRQLLTALDYDKLTDYQAKCVLLIEKDLKSY